MKQCEWAFQKNKTIFFLEICKEQILAFFKVRSLYYNF